MSLNEIRSTVKNFLSNDNPELIILKGKWGVGKTFFWQDLLKKGVSKGDLFKKPADKIQLALNHYAYISLFGIESIGELKEKIVIEEQLVKEADSTHNKLNSFATKLVATLEKHPKLTQVASY
jgi:Cdc6-like AAA superfamily ATPase